MRLEWTEPALADLEALRDYIAADSPANADRFIERLLAATARLTAHPSLGRAVPEAEDTPEDLRELIYNGYRIVYWVQPDRVQILAVLHGARDLQGMPKKPWE